MKKAINIKVSDEFKEELRVFSFHSRFPISEIMREGAKMFMKAYRENPENFEYMKESDFND
ncbi:MAG: hypothetical protein PWP15_1129 [Methanothermococcus sp.]|uniref:hypothetical protein n=1 Tax=Methanothermococcus sp. TaxID=2614238 RepID=UPI0025858FCD|nr:hypothetical protein [Methanothermococcus sp.]MDK2790622.1 hypothetical protein [Methanothermococcus sp.]